MQITLEEDKYKEHILQMVEMISRWFNESDDLTEVFWKYHDDELYLVQIVNVVVKAKGLSWIGFPPGAELKVAKNIEQLSKDDFDNFRFKGIRKDSDVSLEMFNQCDKGNLLSLLAKEDLRSFVLNADNFKGSIV